MGLGFALRTGLQKAEGEVVDSDRAFVEVDKLWFFGCNGLD
jgi:hypothetical protein